MSQRIYWEPVADLTPDHYSIYVVAAREQLLSSIPNNIPGPYWLPTQRRFTIEDPQGTDTTIYRVRAFGPGGVLYGDTGPFQASAAVAARIAARKQIDHNFGGPDTLRYAVANGSGVPDALVRVFLAVDWDAGRRAAPLNVVETDVNGRWKSPVWIEPGQDVVVVFEKSGAYGPDIQRITV
jgi:hypothetical protein